MVIGERVRVSLTNVLLAVDFSETSLLAFPFAAGIAQHYGGKVFLVHVTKDCDRLQIGPEARQMLDKMLIAAEEGAIASLAGSPNTPHVGVSDYGSVYPTLLTVASKSNVDLIVIGTHGRVGSQEAAPWIEGAGDCLAVVQARPGSRSQGLDETRVSAHSVRDQLLARCGPCVACR